MLSIIIINYRTFEYTKNCIESIFKHTQNITYEIILIDNNSNDGSAELLKKLFPNISHIQNKENIGFSKGNNEGIKVAKGEYILLLNSDTQLCENSISYCYKHIEKKPSDVVSCKLLFPNNQIQHQCSKFPTIYINFIELFRIHKLWKKDRVEKEFLSSYFDHETYCEPDWVWGTFFMFKKSILEKLNENKLNDDFFMYGEDMRWCYDFKNIGCKIVYLPETRIIHFIGMSSGNSLQKFKHIIKNELIFIKSTKGRLYCTFFKIFRVVNLLSTFSKNNWETALLYLKN